MVRLDPLEYDRIETETSWLSVVGIAPDSISRNCQMVESPVLAFDFKEDCPREDAVVAYAAYHTWADPAQVRKQWSSCASS
jgi:hypothetical protein